MDPITFGRVDIGVAGSSLCTVSILAHYALKANEEAIVNMRSMQDNKKKIQKYLELWMDIKKEFGGQLKLCIFTLSEKIKKEFLSLCEKIPCEIQLFKN